MRRLLILLSIGLILLMYAIPYMVLSRAHGLELLIFWSVVTLLVGVLSMFHLWRSARMR